MRFRIETYHYRPMSISPLIIALLLLGSYLMAPAQITSVSVGEDTVTILGSSPGGASQLVELLPHQDVNGGIEVSASVGEGGFELELPRSVEGRDRIYSRWKLGGGHPMWATDVSAAAEYAELEPMVAKNRKGLGGIHSDPRLFDDLLELGIGHLTVNVPLREKFSDRRLRQLDRLLEFAHENGIVVTAILLIPPGSGGLVHPDCDPSAHYSLPDMTSVGGVQAFASTVRFLAERYCKPGAPHGRISHWIVGNEVDAGWVWTNGGEMTAEQYMDEYHRAMRVAYYSVRRYDPGGKVFISLTHHWNSSHKPDPKRFYKPRHLLELLRDHCRRSGDFEWGLAYHPYADDLFNPRTWEDKLAHDSFDSPLITMKNIAVLERFMQQPGFRYLGGEARTILLSEQGYHSPEKAADGEVLQAAAIAYAWQQLKPLETIEAFHYHRWIDHEREGGLRCGLWTVKKGSITSPERKKRSWGVFKALDSGDEASATGFAWELIGEPANK
ncbi:MAG: DUF5722 domain-containing protein [Verrucomicrobiales bacterium]